MDRSTSPGSAAGSAGVPAANAKLRASPSAAIHFARRAFGSGGLAFGFGHKVSCLACEAGCLAARGPKPCGHTFSLSVQGFSVCAQSKNSCGQGGGPWGKGFGPCRRSSGPGKGTKKHRTPGRWRAVKGGGKEEAAPRSIRRGRQRGAAGCGLRPRGCRLCRGGGRSAPTWRP